MQSQKNNQGGQGERSIGSAPAPAENPGGKTMNSTTLEAPDAEAVWAAGEERRRFLLTALAHDVVDEAVTELLFDHVVRGRYHWTVVSASLAPILSEAAMVADEADWVAVADHLLEPEAPVTDPPGSRRSEQGTDFSIDLIRGFLRAACHDPLVAGRVERHPVIGRRGFDPAYRAGVLKGEVLDGFRSGTEEDWNMIAGQLIAEAREVTGPAAKGGRS